MPRVWSARTRSARSTSGLAAARACRESCSPSADQRHELVGVEDARDALQDRREAVQAEAGVDVLRRQRRQRVHRVLLELHEHEVPVLEEALVVAAGQVVGLAEVQAAVEVELAARAAGAGRAGLPEVLAARAADDPLTRDADLQPRLDRLLVRAEAELLVALEDRDPDVVRVEAEALQRQLPGELDRALLEVVAHREVAEHLEERQVARGRGRPGRCPACGSTSGSSSAGGAAASRGPGSTA